MEIVRNFQLSYLSKLAPKLLGISIVIALLFSSNTRGVIDIQGRSGIDHGQLAVSHEQSAYKFVNKYFKKDNGQYDLNKIANFIIRLHREKESLKKDLYNTKLIEKIEYELVRPKKAYQSAEKEASEYSNMVRGYNEFLIPKIEKLYQLVARNERVEECDGVVDDFIRGYNPYYMPNAHRTIFGNDNDVTEIAKRIFVGYKFNKNDANKTEASNLIVEQENQLEISKCLKRNVSINYYLNPTEINTLVKVCNYDISKINPGVSAFWRPILGNERQNITATNYDEFPRPEEKLTFKRIRYRGAGSEKMTVTYIRNNKKIPIKLKMGEEVHTDPAASYLGLLAGFNQDHMAYRKLARVYLGKLSYQDFCSELSSRYGIKAISRYIKGHGVEKSSGEEWVEMHNVALEARPEDEIRISPMDLACWDLRNRREYRAYLLWLAFMGHQDTKQANMKFLFKQTKYGLVPLHRHQDVGYCLGTNLLVRNPNDFLYMNLKFKVNSFKTSFMNYSQDEVQILWDDFYNRKRNFKDTTYYDVKWMARQIAKITPKEMEAALSASGMPIEMVALYTKKLILRRNEMVKAFHLENEIPLFPVPVLANNEYLRDDKIVKISPNESVSPLTNQNWLSFLSGLVRSFSSSIPYASINQKLEARYQHALSMNFVTGTGNISGHNGADSGMDSLYSSNNSSSGDKEKLGPFSLGQGISFTIDRRVRPNGIGLVSEGKARNFVITDILEFSIGVDTSLGNTLMQFLPFDLGGKVQLFSKGITFTHYAETLKEGYLSPLKIFKFLVNPEYYAVNELLPFEFIKIITGFGFDSSISGGIKIPFLVNAESVLKSSIGASLKWYQTRPIVFLRDPYGEFHVYQEQTSIRGASFAGTILDPGALFLGDAFLSFSASTFKTNYLVRDMVIDIPESGMDRDKASTTMALANHSKELELVKEVMKMPLHQLNRTSSAVSTSAISTSVITSSSSSINISPSVPLKLRTNYEISATTNQSTSGHSFLFMYGKSKKNQHSEAEITTSDGNKLKLAQLYYSNEHHYGQGTSPLDFAGNYTLVKNAQRKTFQLEMDYDNPQNFVVIIHTSDYINKADRQQLTQFINDVNKRFSKDENHPFFNNYILPPKEDLDRYIKIESRNRIYLNGKKITSKIDELTLEEWKQLINDEYTSFNLQKYCPRKNYSLARTSFGLYFKKNTILGIIKDIKKVQENDPKNYKKIAEFTFKLINELYSNQHGINVIHHIFGDDALFVCGEIFGILRGFSSLYELQELARRRFAGETWGKLDYLPPVQYYLRHKQVTPSLYEPKERTTMFMGIPSTLPIDQN